MSASWQPEPASGLLEAVVTSASDAVLITDVQSLDAADGGPRIVYANPAFTAMTGYAAEEVVDQTPRLLQCEKTDAAQLRRIRTALGRWEGVQADLLNRRKDGSEFWVQLSISPARDASGRVTHWVSIQRDITERRERERVEAMSLRSARDRLRGAFAHAPIGMAVASPAGTLHDVNAALARLLGRDREVLIGETLFDITHPDDRAAAVGACESLRARGGTSRMESRFEHADGHHMDVVVHASLVTDTSGAPDHVIMHVEDVSERNALELELVRQALSDDLTHLPNRPMLLDRLGQALARRNRDGTSLALLFIDVDGFKSVNDMLGHAAGDALLIAFARRLQDSIRPGDTVARFGGDEFVVLCERTDPAEAEAIARRLAAVAAEPHAFLGDLPTSASIGLALASGPEEAMTDVLLRQADAAMYEAKRSGRGNRVTFDAALEARDGHRRQVETELHQALRRGELRLLYQPQIDLRDDRVAGLEALVRWRHPARGLLTPHEFIPAAERSGLITDLGAWVVEEACAYAARAREDWVAWINLSARQLRPGLVAEVSAALERSGLAPSRLGLELTESILMHDLRVAWDQLTELRRLGVRLAIDDFGTGYSSLSYLAELPVDTVKVDRSFTARLEDGGRGRTVVTAVLGMARGLGLDVIVEGVETEVQLAVLRELGVTLAQGHLLGRPAPGAPPG
jgi:diguanylate cyclase (GGDEF)-like protein/PAS domain S-box-containing protein